MEGTVTVRVVETVLDPGVSVLGANPGCIVKLDGDNRREKPLEEIVVSTELLFCWASCSVSLAVTLTSTMFAAGRTVAATVIRSPG